MSIKTKYHVEPLSNFQCKDWIMRKHYARRMPSISYAFGLYEKFELLGVLTIGKPASPSICMGICGKEFADKVYELNRLVVNEKLPKNTLSFFVSQSLKQIKTEMILVSYADEGQHHHGYIYQATNWLYTGRTKERTDIGFEDGSHSRHYDKNLDTRIHRKFRSAKHRYVYFIGRKRKVFKRNLQYKLCEYPKGENRRYNANYQPVTQRLLF